MLQVTASTGGYFTGTGCGLRHLDLRGNGLDDAQAAIILNACAQNKHLESLDLSCNRIGETSVSQSKACAALVGATGVLTSCKRLRALYLAHNQLNSHMYVSHPIPRPWLSA